MYQWTHNELTRFQPNGNGPKTDSDERWQIQSDQEELNCDNNNDTMIVTSESFATVKNKLLQCESTMKISNSATQFDPFMSMDSLEVAHICSDKLNNHMENDENVQQNCDNNVGKMFVETSTQTDDTTLMVSKKVNLEDVQTRPPPPPPPPPPLSSLLPATAICVVPPPCDAVDAIDGPMNNEKLINAEKSAVASPQNNNQIHISSTRLSCASSFCAPPPPPPPGPPPLPLPTGNLWFKCDSKFFKSIFILFELTKA